MAFKVSQLKTFAASELRDINALLRQLSAGDKTCSLVTLKRILGNENIEVWIVRSDKRIIGMGTPVETPMFSGSSGDIEDIVVDERYRGQGLGSKITKKLIARAKARGCRHAELTSRPSRVAANNLYKKLGFTIRKTNVYRLGL
jgi:ribosomal protein S18 acetylase RimI-like enzyme